MSSFKFKTTFGINQFIKGKDDISQHFVKAKLFNKFNLTKNNFTKMAKKFQKGFRFNKIFVK